MTTLLQTNIIDEKEVLVRLDIPASRWYAVIEKRRSRRSYENKPLESGHITEIQSTCNSFSPFPSCRSVFVPESPDSVFRGVIGPYGKIKGAPAFIAFIGNTEYPNVQEQLGYTGEGIILEAEALGLSTCWLALFRAKVAESLIRLDMNEQVIAIAATGYANQKESIGEKLLTGFGWTHKRKPLNELVTGFDESSAPQWVISALNAARLAPSATNRQPWRFAVNSKSITVSANSTRDNFGSSKRLDCGISMLHIEVAALNHGIEGNWEFLEHPLVARYTV